MKIAVYACFKNEIDNVDAWVESIKGADHVTVLDTGSNDFTASSLKHALRNSEVDTFEVHIGAIRPWRFDVGHNAALALVPDDIDVCIPLAGDERLNEGWRNVFPANAPSGPTKFLYPYEFSPALTFHHDRIHSRFGYVWRYPFHEGVYPVMGKEERVLLEGLKITQVQNKAVDRLSRDTALAELAIAEYPDDPRMNFYVGRQFLYAGQLERAMHHLTYYKALMQKRGFHHPVEQEWCENAINDCIEKIKARK